MSSSSSMDKSNQLRQSRTQSSRGSRHVAVAMPTDLSSRRLPMPRRDSRTPAVLHRFAAPSGPWPWAGDLQDDGDAISPVRSRRGTIEAAAAIHAIDWTKYPTSLYPNWTKSVIVRSGIQEVLENDTAGALHCIVHAVDVNEEGHVLPFRSFTDAKPEEFWDTITETVVEHVNLRAFFVEDLSGPVLKMLGACFDIEPFFFSSALNGIPSKYSEDRGSEPGDHITITLPFLRPVDTTRFDKSMTAKSAEDTEDYDAVIDIQSPLPLTSGPDGRETTLLSDLLAVHMIRTPKTSTLISIHTKSDYWLTTSAKQLHDKFLGAGKGVYWGRILRDTNDPIFALLILQWHALYAWDEAMEMLFMHICSLESSVSFDAADIWKTRELHGIRAHLLHYQGLLRQFRKCAKFVQDVGSNNMRPGRDDPDGMKSLQILKKECEIIIGEIDRLLDVKEMLEDRVKNLMDLVFNLLTIKDTETSLRQNSVMKQVAYLTTLFLPATFCGTLFGMNVTQINGQEGEPTLGIYFAFVIPITVLTLWLVLALQARMQDPTSTIVQNLLSPILIISSMMPHLIPRQWRRKPHLEPYDIPLPRSGSEARVLKASRWKWRTAHKTPNY